MNELPEGPDAIKNSTDNLKDDHDSDSSQEHRFSSRWQHVLVAGIVELAAGGGGYALAGSWLKAFFWPIVSWIILIAGYLLKLDTFVYLASGAGLLSFPLLGWFLAHALGFLYGTSVLLVLGILLKLYTVTDAMMTAARSGIRFFRWKRILLIYLFFYSIIPVVLFSLMYRVITASKDDLWVDRGEAILIRRAVPYITPWVDSASLHLRENMVVVASDGRIYRLLAHGPQNVLLFSTKDGFAFTLKGTGKVIRPEPFHEICLVRNSGTFQKCRFIREAGHVVAYPEYFSCTRVDHYAVPPDSWLSMSDWRTCRTPVKILDKQTIVGRPVLILWSGTVLSPAWDRIATYLPSLYEPLH